MNDVERADAVYDALLARAGERWVQPRKERTARVLELLDDPQKTYRVVHITGTNGKTSTARMTESLLRAHGLRTGLFTSPHLERFTERIMVDGEPIGDAEIADAWDEIEPFIGIVDAELQAAGEEPLTFFELLTVLAFVAVADAPVDVLVLEVGMEAPGTPPTPPMVTLPCSRRSRSITQTAWGRQSKRSPRSKPESSRTVPPWFRPSRRRPSQRCCVVWRARMMLVSRSQERTSAWSTSASPSAVSY